MTVCTALLMFASAHADASSHLGSSFRCLGDTARCTPTALLGEGSSSTVHRVVVTLDPSSGSAALADLATSAPLLAVAKRFRAAPRLDSSSGAANRSTPNTPRMRRAVAKELEICRALRASAHIVTCLYATRATLLRPTLLFEDWGASATTQSALLLRRGAARRLNRDARLNVGLHVARALHALHAQRIQHLDVQPANVLVDGALARAALFDFGLAETNGELRRGLRLPVTHAAFAAPELQRTLRPAINTSDIYSWALLQLHLWGACPSAWGQHQRRAGVEESEQCWRVPVVRDARTGALALPPWMEDVGALPGMVHRLIGAGGAAADTDTSMPHALGELLLRCLARDPTRRPQSAGVVVAVLERLLLHGGREAAVDKIFFAPSVAQSRARIAAASAATAGAHAIAECDAHVRAPDGALAEAASLLSSASQLLTSAARALDVAAPLERARAIVLLAGVNQLSAHVFSGSVGVTAAAGSAPHYARARAALSRAIHELEQFAQDDEVQGVGEGERGAYAALLQCAARLGQWRLARRWRELEHQRGNVTGGGDDEEAALEAELRRCAAALPQSPLAAEVHAAFAVGVDAPLCLAHVCVKDSHRRHRLHLPPDYSASAALLRRCIARRSTATRLHCAPSLRGWPCRVKRWWRRGSSSSSRTVHGGGEAGDEAMGSRAALLAAVARYASAGTSGIDAAAAAKPPPCAALSSDRPDAPPASEVNGEQPQTSPQHAKATALHRMWYKTFPEGVPMDSLFYRRDDPAWRGLLGAICPGPPRGVGEEADVSNDKHDDGDRGGEGHEGGVRMPSATLSEIPNREAELPYAPPPQVLVLCSNNGTKSRGGGGRGALLTIRRETEGKLQLLRRIDLATLLAPLRTIDDDDTGTTGEEGENLRSAAMSSLVWVVDGDGTLLLAPEDRFDRFAAPPPRDVVATLRFTLASTNPRSSATGGGALSSVYYMGPHPHDAPRAPRSDGTVWRRTKHADLSPASACVRDSNGTWFSRPRFVRGSLALGGELHLFPASTESSGKVSALLDSDSSYVYYRIDSEVVKTEHLAAVAARLAHAGLDELRIALFEKEALFPRGERIGEAKKRLLVREAVESGTLGGVAVPSRQTGNSEL